MKKARWEYGKTRRRRKREKGTWKGWTPVTSRTISQSKYGFNLVLIQTQSSVVNMIAVTGCARSLV